MSVAAQPDVGQFDEIDIHAGLLEISGGAMVVGGIEGGLGGQIQNRPLADCNELARWLLLSPALHQVGPIGLAGLLLASGRWLFAVPFGAGPPDQER